MARSAHVFWAKMLRTPDYVGHRNVLSAPSYAALLILRDVVSTHQQPRPSVANRRYQVLNISSCVLERVFTPRHAPQVCATFYYLRFVPTTSTEADDYSANSSSDATFKVLIVSRVVVGKSLKRKTNATNLTELPCGYHSVSHYTVLPKLHC